MLKQFFVLISGVMLMFSLFSNARAADADTRTAYDFSFKTLIGQKLMPLSAYKGKVVLVVNTASECGFTPQYEGLEKLYEHYQARGLIIIGVPSNDFGGQEPGSNEEIAHFCKLNYGVSFPMAAKEAVSGDAAHPFYLWARDVLGFGTAPKWNFHKYLVNRDGKLIDHFNSTTGPDAARLKDAIEKTLSQKAGEPVIINEKADR